jgi:hypothetical protein
MAAITLPEFAAGQPAARVDESLRQALAACDRARECAVLWFAEVQRRRLYRQLGHPSLELYATEALGFSRNRYWQFKRLADDLDRLPVLREAVAAGEVGWTKAQQVARVATEATQVAWVAIATTTSRRELEQEVRQAKKRRPVEKTGQLALEAPTVPAAEPPTTVSLRASAVQLARFEALAEKAHKLGLIAAGADRMDLVLAGLEALVDAGAAERPRSHGPAVQIVVRKCPECEAAAVVTSRGEKPLAPAQFDALADDARVQEPSRPNRATIAPSVRAAVMARDRHRCTTPGCGATHFLEVHHLKPRHLGGTNRPDNLVTLCSRCHAFVHTLAPAQAEGVRSMA